MKKTALTPAERGTALHLAMQYIDFANCEDTEGVTGELQRLTEKGLLTEEQAAAIDTAKITQFLKSDIGKRVRNAKDVKREFKFSLLCPASQFFPCGGDDELLLQGVIDCFFEEDGALTVVDFKTDRVTPETLEEKTNQYTPQLTTYAQALKRITNKQVREAVLYFFALNKGITIAPDQN